jgi:hypothetical protein
MYMIMKIYMDRDMDMAMNMKSNRFIASNLNFDQIDPSIVFSKFLRFRCLLALTLQVFLSAEEKLLCHQFKSDVSK